MRKEQYIFSLHIEAHNDTGEKIRCPVLARCTRTEVVHISERLGVIFSYAAPYTMRKERSFPIEKAFVDEIRLYTGVILAEFKNEPMLCIKRI